MYKHRYNAKQSKGEKPSLLPSATIPGQSISVQQMIDRLRSGLPVMGGLRMEYQDDDDEEPRFEPKDLTDLDDAQRFINSVQKKQSDKKSAGNTTGTSEASEEPAV